MFAGHGCVDLSASKYFHRYRTFLYLHEKGQQIVCKSYLTKVEVVLVGWGNAGTKELNDLGKAIAINPF